jgi:hypothetical protein
MHLERFSPAHPCADEPRFMQPYNSANRLPSSRPIPLVRAWENGLSEGAGCHRGGSLVGAVIACWFGQYKIAFWATVCNTLSGGVMVAAIVRDRSWHAARQSPNVRLETDNDDEEEITAFVMTKVVVIVVSAVLCWYFGKWAGYF